MSISQINLNSINGGFSSNNTFQKACKTAQSPAFKGDDEPRDTFVVKRQKPSFWNKYRGLIGLVAGWTGGDILARKLMPNPTTTKSLLISIPIGLGCGILGQEVATLVNGYQSAAKYQVSFNASKLASGVYLYTIKADNFIQTMKMILMK